MCPAAIATVLPGRPAGPCIRDECRMKEKPPNPPGWLFSPLFESLACMANTTGAPSQVVVLSPETKPSTFPQRLIGVLLCSVLSWFLDDSLDNISIQGNKLISLICISMYGWLFSAEDSIALLLLLRDLRSNLSFIDALLTLIHLLC